MTNTHDNERGMTVNDSGCHDSDRAVPGGDRANPQRCPAPPRIAALFERSSFGTEGARAVRASVPSTAAARPSRRAHYRDAGIDVRDHARYLESLEITDQDISGSRTPEFAFRTPGHGDVREWQLSWLPGRRLTRAQALHGMVLDNIICDPDLSADPEAIDFASAAAADLDLTLAEASLAITEGVLLRRGRLTHRELADCRGASIER
ncbi:hypothetical protein ACIP5Y_19815 [Nocardia sp. NPDC088792]|uniref:hypothetical protein n=1 Tax=Nocardia sp. NPDC088792 TaxID=3364332 RepID=UPI0037FB7764